MKLTKQQRAQVVELLRCAADLGMRNVPAPPSEAAWLPLSEAAWRTGIHWHIEVVADAAVQAVVDSIDQPWFSAGWDDYAEHCLEAAARVELEEWP